MPPQLLHNVSNNVWQYEYCVVACWNQWQAACQVSTQSHLAKFVRKNGRCVAVCKRRLHGWVSAASANQVGQGRVRQRSILRANPTMRFWSIEFAFWHFWCCSNPNGKKCAGVRCINALTADSLWSRYGKNFTMRIWRWCVRHVDWLSLKKIELFAKYVTSPPMGTKAESESTNISEPRLNTSFPSKDRTEKSSPFTGCKNETTKGKKIIFLKKIYTALDFAWKGKRLYTNFSKSKKLIVCGRSQLRIKYINAIRKTPTKGRLCLQRGRRSGGNDKLARFLRNMQ